MGGHGPPMASSGMDMFTGNSCNPVVERCANCCETQNFLTERNAELPRLAVVNSSTRRELPLCNARPPEEKTARSKSAEFNVLWTIATDREPEDARRDLRQAQRFTGAKVPLIRAVGCLEVN